jgi:hypothetical protein
MLKRTLYSDFALCMCEGADFPECLNVWPGLASLVSARLEAIAGSACVCTKLNQTKLNQTKLYQNLEPALQARSFKVLHACGNLPFRRAGSACVWDP